MGRLVKRPSISRKGREEKFLSLSHKRSPKQEESLAKRLGGTRTGATGLSRNNIAGKADRPHRGDVNVRGVARIEAKTTSAKSFSVTREMIDKITNAAIGADVVPAIVIEFLNAHGAPDCEVAVIPVAALELLIGHATKDTQ